MRTVAMLMLTGGLIGSAATAAPPPAQATPDQIICAVSGDCGDSSAPDASKQIKTHDEKAFSLALPSSGGSTPPRSQPSVGPRTASIGSRRPVGHRPVGTGAAVRHSDGSVDMNLTFELGSASLTPSARSQASAFATAMKSQQLSAMRFSIEGHTDSIGSRTSNVDLSQRRAQAVVDYLVAQGIDAGRLEAKGFGPDKPLPGTSARSPANRRVALVKQG